MKIKKGKNFEQMHEVKKKHRYALAISVAMRCIELISWQGNFASPNIERLKREKRKWKIKDS